MNSENLACGGYIDPNKLSSEDIEYSTPCEFCKKYIPIKFELDKPITNYERWMYLMEDHGQYFCEECYDKLIKIHEIRQL